MPPPLHNAAIILVAPQMGENIGAAARAMANFGLRDLRLVSPRDGWPSDSATAMAVGALDHLDPVRIFATLAEAAADRHTLYATTARTRDMVKPVLTPRRAALDAGAQLQAGQAVALVFGGERAGLNNEDIAACHNIVTIPANPDFSSFNLGQSVLLLCYELAMAFDKTEEYALDPGESFPVPQDKMDEFMTRLEDELERGNFFRSSGLRPTMVRNIRTLFTRAQPTDQEVRTLHGIVSALTGKKGR